MTAASNRAKLLAGKRITFPADAPDASRRLRASAIREAAATKQPIDISNAIIYGPADFYSLHFSDDVKIAGSTFLEFADFAYAEFTGSAQFPGTIFSQGASFDSTRFRSDVALGASKFQAAEGTRGQVVLFNDSDFGGVLDLTNARFAKDVVASFTRVRFRSSAFFHGSDFGGEVDFSQAQSDGGLDFRNARFRRAFEGEYLKVNQYLTFNQARFRVTASLSLRESEIGGTLYGGSARFGSSFDLSAARIRSSLDLSSACFLGRTTFDGCVISGKADFSRARFGKRAPIQFRSASVARGVDWTAVRCGSFLDFSDSTSAAAFLAEGSTFRGRVSLDRAHISRSLVLRDSDFGDFSLDAVRVDGQVDCSSAVFKGYVWGRDARLGALLFDGQVRGQFDIAGTHIDGALLLDRAEFRSHETSLDLAGVSVGTRASLRGATFRGRINGVGFRVEQQLELGLMVCGGSVSFYELEVKRGVFIRQSRFRDTFSLDSAKIGGALYLAGTVFRGLARFEDAAIRTVELGAQERHGNRAAAFLGGLHFSRSTLHYLNFRGVQCESTKVPAELSHMLISGSADFSEACFHGKVTFYSSVFGGEARFEGIHFKGPESVDLRGTRFRDRAYFAPALFDGGADFTYARFESQAVFRARFKRAACFDSCRFLGNAEFCSSGSVDGRESSPDEGSILPLFPQPTNTWFEEATFAHAEFAADAQFENVRFGKRLDLRETKFVSLFLPVGEEDRIEQLLPHTVDARGCEYAQISTWCASFLEKPGGNARLDPYDRQPYSQLEGALRTEGQETIADQVHLLWRRVERDHFRLRKNWPSWLLSWGYRLIANYGIRPYRLGVMSVLLLLGGTLYFDQPGTMKKKPEGPGVPIEHNGSLGDAFGMSLRQFLPITIPLSEDLIPSNRRVDLRTFIPRWDSAAQQPVMTIRATPVAVATILKLCGWLLVPLGVGALTGILRRLPGQ